MKELLLILSLLLTCATTQAQRYRLVADSTYEYEQGQPVLWEVNRYAYKTDNPLATRDGKNFFYDTMYHYYCYGDKANLSHYKVREYNGSQKLVKETQYEQVPIHSNYDAADGVDYYQDGAMVPKAADSFVYNYHGQLVAHYRYETKGYYSSDLQGRDCFVQYPGAYVFHLRHLTIYEYTNGNQTSETAYTYTDVGAVEDASYKQYGYDKKDRQVQAHYRDEQQSLVMAIATKYKKQGEEKRYSVYSKGKVMYEEKVSCHTLDGVYTRKRWRLEKEEKDKLLIIDTHSYGQDSLLLQQVETVCFDSEPTQQNVKTYTYNILGYRHTKEEKRVLLHPQPLTTDKTKTTYTYEQY